MRDILCGLATLLEQPEMDAPIRSRAAEVYTNKAVYDARAREAAEQATELIDHYPYMAGAECFTHEMQEDETFDDALETQLLMTRSLARQGARFLHAETSDSDY